MHAIIKLLYSTAALILYNKTNAGELAKLHNVYSSGVNGSKKGKGSELQFPSVQFNAVDW